MVKQVLPGWKPSGFAPASGTVEISLSIVPAATHPLFGGKNEVILDDRYAIQ